MWRRPWALAQGRFASSAMFGRMARGSARVVAVGMLLTACSGGASSVTTQQLTAEPLQYRDDIAINQMQLQVTNGLDEQLQLTGVQFLWEGFDSELEAFDILIGVGQRIDLPVAVLAPRCRIEGTTVLASPPMDSARVVLTLADGSTRTAEVTDADGTATAIHRAGCERRMIESQVAIGFDDVRRSEVDGRPMTVAELRLDRAAATTTVRVVTAGNTIPFTLRFPDVPVASPALVEMPAASEYSSERVQFTEGRCDAHAVAESKQPFRFVLHLDLGDGVDRSYVVQPDQAVQPEMLATVAEGCAALGTDGTFAPGG